MILYHGSPFLFGNPKGSITDGSAEPVLCLSTNKKIALTFTKIVGLSTITEITDSGDILHLITNPLHYDSGFLYTFEIDANFVKAWEDITYTETDEFRVDTSNLCRLKLISRQEVFHKDVDTNLAIMDLDLLHIMNDELFYFKGKLTPNSTFINSLSFDTVRTKLIYLCAVICKLGLDKTTYWNKIKLLSELALIELKSKESLILAYLSSNGCNSEFVARTLIYLAGDRTIESKNVFLHNNRSDNIFTLGISFMHNNLNGFLKNYTKEISDYASLSRNSK